MSSAKLPFVVPTPWNLAAWDLAAWDLASRRRLRRFGMSLGGTGFAEAMRAKRGALFKFELQRQAPRRQDWVI